MKKAAIIILALWLSACHSGKIAIVGLPKYDQLLIQMPKTSKLISHSQSDSILVAMGLDETQNTWSSYLNGSVLTKIRLRKIPISIVKRQINQESPHFLEALVNESQFILKRQFTYRQTPNGLRYAILDNDIDAFKKRDPVRNTIIYAVKDSTLCEINQYCHFQDSAMGRNLIEYVVSHMKLNPKGKQLPYILQERSR